MLAPPPKWNKRFIHGLIPLDTLRITLDPFTETCSSGPSYPHLKH